MTLWHLNALSWHLMVTSEKLPESKAFPKCLRSNLTSLMSPLEMQSNSLETKAKYKVIFRRPFWSQLDSTLKKRNLIRYRNYLSENYTEEQINGNYVHYIWRDQCWDWNIWKFLTCPPYFLLLEIISYCAPEGRVIPLIPHNQKMGQSYESPSLSCAPEEYPLYPINEWW